ncbi:MAG: hypothetical protein ACN6O5_19745 [Achromobacter sp.]|uniref:hypothetical protein n=1 Tax=Achromobacter sp. TaxID=134375 RepID=UPI003D054B34
MATNKGLIEVLTDPSIVSKFLDEVARAADSEKDALGFFPRSVYHDYCRKGQLFVARERGHCGDIYVGHLLFDLRFPKAHVRQIHVPKDQRGRNVGKLLLTAMKGMSTDAHFISIQARVAEDLKALTASGNHKGFTFSALKREGSVETVRFWFEFMSWTPLNSSPPVASPRLIHSGLIPWKEGKDPCIC